MHNKIKTTKELSRKAFIELKRFQTGEKTLVKTGRPYIDSHLGGLKPSDLVLIGAKSGVGKTYELMKICRNILDTSVNPKANNYVSLEFMLEMKFLDLILRDTHRLTKKKKRDILTKEFTEEEKEVVREYNETLNDGRRFVVDESVNTKEYFEIVDDFCDKNKDKDYIILSLDHILLITGENRAENPLDTLAEKTNVLRKKYDNIVFIYLSQLNRYYPPEVREKSNEMLPKTKHIYGSSQFEFLSAYVVVMANPFKMGVEEYMRVKPDRYEDYRDVMTEENSNGLCSFKTMGYIFYHTLKTRESDVPYNNLYIEEMNLTEEQKKKMEMDSESEKEDFSIEEPMFGEEDKKYFDLSKHREDVPF